jgi:radical SAM superfamily enzyme YgiQ (UPF0313 family)
MNLVLTNTPIPELKWNVGAFPPLGLLYVAASVKALPGVKVHLVDTANEGYDAEQAAAAILAQRPDLLGLSLTSCGLENVAPLLAAVKQASPRTTIVAGGIHATLFDRLLLQEVPQVDLVLRGEADDSFPELCRRLLAGQDVAGVPGLSYRAKDGVVSGDPQLVEDLDALPFPDRSVLAQGRYGRQLFGFKLPGLPPFTTAFSSRGCPFRCTFCSSAKLCDGRLRTRRAENVLTEIEELHRQGIRVVFFCDDNFTGEVERVNELCRLIIDRGLKMRFGCIGTLHNVPDATLRLMHRAGFDFVFLGVESGSNDQLRRFRKPTTREVMGDSLKRAKKAHFITIASFIVGGIGETAADHQATVSFIRQARPHLAEMAPLIVLPGSQDWDELHPQGDPETLAETGIKLITSYPGQIPRKLIWARQRDLYRAQRYAMFNPRMILDLIRLLLYNGLVKKTFKDVFKNPRLALQLFRGR